MKVPTKTPTEEVKFTNVFGDEYTPEEEYEFICDDCLAEEVDSLKENIIGLSEDILDYGDALVMLWEKIQAVEDDQLQDIENLSETVKILECMQKANRMMLDVIMELDKCIKTLDKLSAIWGAIVFIWLTVLTVLFWIYVF